MSKHVYGKILIAALRANVATIKLLFNTIFEYYDEYLIQLTGNFGWFDTPVSIIFVVFVLFSLLLFSFFDVRKGNKIKVKFKKWEIVYIYFLSIL